MRSSSAPARSTTSTPTSARPGASGCTTLIGGASVVGRSSAPGKLTSASCCPSRDVAALPPVEAGREALTAPFTLKVDEARDAAPGSPRSRSSCSARALAYALSPSPLPRALAPGRRPRPAGDHGRRDRCSALGLLGRGRLARGARRPRAPLARARPVVAQPRLRVWLLPRASTSSSAGSDCSAFAMLESTLHWRAGLGWHGLHCLTGPVHRNAIPILGALSLARRGARGGARARPRLDAPDARLDRRRLAARRRRSPSCGAALGRSPAGCVRRPRSAPARRPRVS